MADKPNSGDIFYKILVGLKNSEEFSLVSSYDHKFRERLAEAAADTIITIQAKEGWKDLLLAVFNKGVVLYCYSFVLAIQRTYGGIISNMEELKKHTNIYEIEPIDFTVEVALSEGAVWSKEKHAECLLSFVLECGTGFAYVRVIENMIRKGFVFRAVNQMDPMEYPWLLPPTFAFGRGFRLNKTNAIAYALASAKDFFIAETLINANKIQQETEIPFDIIEKAIEYRDHFLESRQ